MSRRGDSAAFDMCDLVEENLRCNQIEVEQIFDLFNTQWSAQWLEKIEAGALTPDIDVKKTPIVWLGLWNCIWYLAKRYHQDPSLVCIPKAFAAHSNVLGRWCLCLVRLARGNVVGYQPRLAAPRYLAYQPVVLIILAVLELLSKFNPEGGMEEIVATNENMLTACVHLWALAARTRKMFSTHHSPLMVVEVATRFFHRLKDQPDNVWEQRVLRPISESSTSTVTAIALSHLSAAINATPWNPRRITQTLEVIEILGRRSQSAWRCLLKEGLTKKLMATMAKTLAHLRKSTSDEVTDNTDILATCAMYLHGASSGPAGLCWSLQMVQDGVLRLMLSCDPWGEYIGSAFAQMVVGTFRQYCSLKSFLKVLEKEVEEIKKNKLAQDITSPQVLAIWSQLDANLRFHSLLRLWSCTEDSMVFETCGNVRDHPQCYPSFFAEIHLVESVGQGMSISNSKFAVVATELFSAAKGARSRDGMRIRPTAKRSQAYMKVRGGMAARNCNISHTCFAQELIIHRSQQVI